MSRKKLLLATSRLTGAGSMTLAIDGTSGMSGYMAAGYATAIGTSTFGSITGQPTGFGTISAMYQATGGGAAVRIAIASPLGTPTGLVINGVPFALTPAGTFSGYSLFDTTTTLTLTGGANSWSIS